MSIKYFNSSLRIHQVPAKQNNNALLLKILHGLKDEKQTTDRKNSYPMMEDLKNERAKKSHLHRNNVAFSF